MKLIYTLIAVLFLAMSSAQGFANPGQNCSDSCATGGCSGYEDPFAFGICMNKCVSKCTEGCKSCHPEMANNLRQQILTPKIVNINFNQTIIKDHDLMNLKKYLNNNKISN